MTARPKPPEGFDENPPLDADYFARARLPNPRFRLGKQGLSDAARVEDGAERSKS
jgi:hypothetical protein